MYALRKRPWICTCKILEGRLHEQSSNCRCWSVTVDCANCGRSVAAAETSLSGGCLPPRSRLGVGPIIPRRTQIEYCAVSQRTLDLDGCCKTASARGR